MLANPLPPLDRNSLGEVFCKKMFLKISQNSQENTYATVSFLIMLQAYSFITKETLTEVFSREFCEIFKNAFFIKHLRTNASIIHTWKSALRKAIKHALLCKMSCVRTSQYQPRFLILIPSRKYKILRSSGHTFIFHSHLMPFVGMKKYCSKS